MPATYDLQLVKKLIQEGRYTITQTAANTAKQDFGLDAMQIVEKIKSLRSSEFYKTMPSEQKPGMWQDVYRQRITLDKKQVYAYVKLQINQFSNGQMAVIISYKYL